MAEADDPYATLGVGQQATPSEIRAAFRRLARRYHPDVATDEQAGRRMAADNSAYALLSDPVRRQQYDQRHPRPDAHARPPARRPTTAEPELEEVPVWSADLETHADDWRQMLEEERRMWEQLLAAGPGAANRPHLERELVRAQQAQLELENTLRARAGQDSLTQPEFEKRRLEERDLARRQTHAAGCLLLGMLALTPPLLARTLMARRTR